MEIIKLGILSFFSSHGIRAKGENLIYFFSDRVSFRSPSPPPDLLLSATAAAVTAAADFPGSSSPAGNHRFRGARDNLHAGGNPTGNQQHTRRHAPPFLRQLAVHAPARECACGRVAPFPVTRLHTQGRLAPSCCSIPRAIHPEPSLSTFWPILPLPPSISRLLYDLGPLFLHLQFHSRDFKFHSRDFKLRNRDSPSYSGSLQSKRDSISS